MDEPLSHFDLCEAASKANSNIFMTNIKEIDGTNLDTYDKKGRTLLTSAASGGNLSIVEHLISIGADLNKTSWSMQSYGKNRTPVYLALSRGHLKVAKILVQNGANPDLQEDSIIKDFANAVIKGETRTVESILETKIDVNQNCAIYKTTALCWAALFGHLDIVKLLVDAGADIDFQDKQGNTPLIYAIRGEDLDIAEYLIMKGCNSPALQPVDLSNIFQSLSVSLKMISSLCVDKQPDNSSGSSHATHTNSSKTCNLGVIESLVRKKMDIKKVACLSTAVMSGYVHVVEYVMSLGCDVNEIGSDGNTPLINAVRIGNEFMVQKLINSDADVCGTAPNGTTPLFYAVGWQKMSLIKRLLDNGASPVASVFYNAIRRGSLEIVKLLAEKGAVINFISQNGETPLSKAVECGRAEIAMYLVKCGADPQVVINKPKNSFLMKGVTDENIKMVEFLVELGAKLELPGYDGFTPLTKSVEMDRLGLVEYFIGKGVDVNLKDGNDKTALGIAASKSNFLMCKILVESGANIELVKAEVVTFSQCNEDFAKFLITQKK